MSKSRKKRPKPLTDFFLMKKPGRPPKLSHVVFAHLHAALRFYSESDYGREDLKTHKLASKWIERTWYFQIDEAAKRSRKSKGGAK